MTADVSTPSLDHVAMQTYWNKVDAIMGGAETMRKAKQFLPIFPNESQKDYDFRLANAKFTNVFRDICENLAAKPFAKELTVKDAETSPVKDLIEDIDGEGNHIHLFAADAFYRGLSHALHWIFIDFPVTSGALKSAADEKAANARPYWISIPATQMIAAETVKIGAKVYWSHVRFRADTVIRAEYEETKVERIREYNREANGTVSFKLWQKAAAVAGVPAKWAEVPDASGFMTIDEIPLVLFMSGRPKGGNWQVEPMLQDAADLQIELYQQESGLKYAKESAAFPMLAGNGVSPALGADGKPVSVPVGPKTVLYAPPNGEGEHGEWTFIEPSAESLRFLADDVKETISQLRELGRQPLTAQSGNLTVVTTQFAAQKGNSAVMAAALLMKDALENALRITTKMMKQEAQPEVEIFTDFDIAINDDKGPDTLNSARKNGDLSQRTYWAELQRRNILSANFDAEQEEEALEKELPGNPSEQDLIDAGTIAAGPAGARAA